MDNQIVVHSHQTTAHNEEEWIIEMCGNLDESPENNAEWKEPISKGYILNDAIYVTFWNYKIIEMER